MLRTIKVSGLVLALLASVSCGESELSSPNPKGQAKKEADVVKPGAVVATAGTVAQGNSNSTAAQGAVSKTDSGVIASGTPATTQPAQTANPVVVATAAPVPAASAFSVTAPTAYSLNQGATGKVDIKLKAGAQPVTVTLTPPAQVDPKVGLRLTDATGTVVTSVQLAANEEKTVVAEFTSIPTMAGTVYTAPGPMAAKAVEIGLAGGGTTTKASMMLDVNTNVVVTMTLNTPNATDRILPSTINVPAGSRLFIANPNPTVSRPLHSGNPCTHAAANTYQTFVNNLAYNPFGGVQVDLKANPNLSAMGNACTAGQQCVVYDHLAGNGSHGGNTTIVCQ